MSLDTSTTTNAKQSCSAHYDHLGMGGENSLYKGPAAIHNGADDNGSGTTLLLEVMRYYAQRQDTNYNYLIQFYSAEELGLIGSKYWTNHPTFPLKEVEYMINSDMVGRLERTASSFRNRNGHGMGRDPRYAYSWFGHQKRSCGRRAVGPDLFLLQGFAGLHLFTGTHDDYHKPTDDAEKINYKGMAKLASLIYTITARTANYENLTSKNYFFRTEDHAELLRDLRSRARLPFWRARASYRRGDRRAPRANAGLKAGT